MTPKQLWKWWHAQFFLAGHALLHFCKKAWPFRKKLGLKQFETNYIDEGLPGFTALHRKIAHEPGRCTGCGMCDEVCPYLKQSQNQFIGPMRLVKSVMRGGPLVLSAMADLQRVGETYCASCNLCQTNCPEQIPIIQLSKMCFEQYYPIQKDRVSAEAVLSADCSPHNSKY